MATVTFIVVGLLLMVFNAGSVLPQELEEQIANLQQQHSQMIQVLDDIQQQSQYVGKFPSRRCRHKRAHSKLIVCLTFSTHTNSCELPPPLPRSS